MKLHMHDVTKNNVNGKHNLQCSSYDIQIKQNGINKTQSAARKNRHLFSFQVKTAVSATLQASPRIANHSSGSGYRKSAQRRGLPACTPPLCSLPHDASTTYVYWKRRQHTTAAADSNVA